MVESRTMASDCRHPVEKRLRYSDQWWERRGPVSAEFCEAISLEEKRLYPASWTERQSICAYLVEACTECCSVRYFGATGFVWETTREAVLAAMSTIFTGGETPAKWFRNKMSEGEMASLATMRAHDGAPFKCSCGPCSGARAKLAEQGIRFDEFGIPRAINPVVADVIRETDFQEYGMWIKR